MALQRILTLRDEQLSGLQHERIHHEHPRVRQRMDALWLSANGMTQLRVPEMLGISRHPFLFAPSRCLGIVTKIRRCWFR